MKKRIAERASNALSAIFVGLVALTAAGTANADVTSTAHIGLSPVSGGAVIADNTTTASGPVSLSNTGIATFTRTDVTSHAWPILPTIAYSEVNSSGTASASGLTQYGAIHGSVSAQSDPFVYVYYQDGNPGNPNGVSWNGVVSQASFQGVWNDTWNLSGIPDACSGSACAITVNGHLQISTGRGPSPSSTVQLSAYDGGYRANFNFSAYDPNTAIHGYSQNLGLNHWYSDTSFYSNNGGVMTNLPGSPDGSHTIPWTVTIPIYGNSDNFGRYLGTEALAIRSEMQLVAEMAGYANASDTGAIDSIILPTGVTLTANSGQLTSLPNGTLTYIAAVPEPEPYALMLAGLGLLGFIARRRKQSHQTV